MRTTSWLSGDDDGGDAIMTRSLPSPSPPSSSSSSSASSSGQLQLYQSIVFATPVLFAALLVLLFCMLCLRRQRQHDHGLDGEEQQHRQQQQQQDEEEAEEEERQNNLQNALHQFIPAHLSLSHLPLYERGLRKSFRQKLPIIPFDEKFAASCEDNQCPVCLCEYQEKEKLQQLPACKHAFHVECIDQWLAKNTTCPICRTSLLQGGGKDVVTGVQSTPSPIENTRWQDRVLNEGQEIVRHNNNISDGASTSSTAIVSSEAAPRFSTEHVVNIERS